MLQKRSSWASAIATGIIGWNSFVVILALALGYRGSAATLILLAALNGIAQPVILKAAFRLLQMDRKLMNGFIWGSITGALAICVELPFVSLFREHAILWILNGIYIGFAVGGFLSYFYRDDKEVEAEAAAAQTKVEYGRDAHWLEPFGFGAAAYLLVFLPRSVDMGVFLLIVGAMVGVFAAGGSHFSGDKWKTSVAATLLFAAIGSLFGLASGLLFRQYQDALFAPPPALGAIAGTITFLVTFLRGKRLARTLPA